VIDRRAFLAGSLGVLTAPLAAGAQQPRRSARVALLIPTVPMPESATSSIGLTRDLPRRLREFGWVEGANLILEVRFAHNQPNRLPNLAADLVRLNVDVIVAVSPPAIKAAKDATTTIPIVMAFSGVDPVKAGFVASLARPGNNVTGLTILASDMAVKRLEVLKEAIPKAAKIGVVVNPRNTSNIEQLAALQLSAPALGVQIHPVEVARSGQYAEMFETVARARPDALIVASDPEFFRDRAKLIELTARTRTPACYEWREFAEAGGLMSYGSNFQDVSARVAGYVDKILRGSKPGELPVEQPTKFELVINAKTAKALGLTIPPSLLLRADQVIE
jgi:putative tryptophan/tyrosine transport system substrate-binding protein